MIPIKNKRKAIVIIHNKPKRHKKKIKHIESKSGFNNKSQSVSTQKFAEEAKPKQISVRIRVDANKDIYKMQYLSKPEIDYLKNKDYKEYRILNIHGRNETYLIRKKRNESISHSFLINDILKYIKPKVLYR